MIPMELSWKSASDQPKVQNKKYMYQLVHSDNFDAYPNPVYFDKGPKQCEVKQQKSTLSQFFKELSSTQPDKALSKKEQKTKEELEVQSKKLLYFYSNLDDLMEKIQNDPRVELLLHQEIEAYFQNQPDKTNFFQYAGEKVRRIIRIYKNPNKKKKKYSSAQTRKKAVRIDCLTEIYLFSINNKPRDVQLTSERFRQFLYQTLRLEGLGEKPRFIPSDLEINLKRRGYDIVNILKGSGSIQKVQQQQNGKEVSSFGSQNNYVVSQKFDGYINQKDYQRQFHQIIDTAVKKAQKKQKQVRKYLGGLQTLGKLDKRNQILEEKQVDDNQIKVDLDNSSYYYLNPEEIQKLQSLSYNDLNQWVSSQQSNPLFPILSKALDQPHNNYLEQIIEEEEMENSYWIESSEESIKNKEEQELKLLSKHFDLTQYDHDLQLQIDEACEKLKLLEAYVAQQQRQEMELQKDFMQEQKPLKTTKGKSKKNNNRKTSRKKVQKNSDDSDQQFVCRKKYPKNKKKKIVKMEKLAKEKVSPKKSDKSRKNLILPPIQAILQNDEEGYISEEINPEKRRLGINGQTGPKHQQMDIQEQRKPIQKRELMDEKDLENV